MVFDCGSLLACRAVPGGNVSPPRQSQPNAMVAGDVSKFVFADPDGGTGTMSIEYKDDGIPDLAIMGGNVGIGTLDPEAKLEAAVKSLMEK